MFKQLKLPFLRSHKQARPNSSSDEYEPEDEARRSEPSSMWTRVRSVDAWQPGTVVVYDIAKDIQQDLSTTRARSHIQGQKSRCLFDPDEYGFKGVDYSQEKH